MKVVLIFSLAFIVSIAHTKREFISDCQQNGRSIFLSCLTELEQAPSDYYEYVSAVCGLIKKQDIIRLKLSHCQMSGLQSYYFFTVFPDITEFQIDDLELEALRPEDFAGARQLERLLAARNRLTQIPARIFERAPKIVNADFSYNRIVQVNDSAFVTAGSTLRILNLSNNYLQLVNKRMFKGLKALDTLYLSTNGIGMIEPLAFVDSTNLTWLDLSLNSINRLHVGTFDGLTNLRSLDLSGNHISRIDHVASVNGYSSVFNPCTHLNTLLLHDNDLPNTNWLVFVELKYLMKLNLANNHIHYVQNDFNGIADGLRLLDLSENDIETIHSNAFYKLNHLLGLNMAHNRISEIDQDTFNGCRSLEVLDLSGNGLESFKSIVTDIKDVII